MSPAANIPTPHKMGTSPGPRTCASPAAWRVRGGGGSERRPLGLLGSPVTQRTEDVAFGAPTKGTHDMTDTAHSDILGQAAQGQLRSIIERIERLEQEKSEIAEQIKEVYAEASGNGFDKTAIRQVVRLRKIDRAKRQEAEAILDLYLSAVGEI